MGINVRLFMLALCLVALGGCATTTYISTDSAEAVSACIAAGWRKSPRFGMEAPVSVTETDKYFFVGVELHPTFPSPVVAGADHPFYAVWAEVSETAKGSATRYHRAYQFTHKAIDTVVVECQKVPGQ